MRRDTASSVEYLQEEPPQVRVRTTVRGRVQGVGFRPYVYGLACELGLAGFVVNSPRGAELEVQGFADPIEEFLIRVAEGLPAPGHVEGLETVQIPAVASRGFEIRQSVLDGSRSATILPDIATCPDCLRELFDATDRRYRYPFINCTHCGPRYTIIRSLPYDRPNTSMAGFAMCPECQAEYENPRDRRYHAQPVACPACGPSIEAWNPRGIVVGDRSEALSIAADCLRHGAIVAVLGIGGFHLLVDARNDEAVELLRTRKRREAKPLAVMCPDLPWAESLADLLPAERRLLGSPEAPIVLCGAPLGGIAGSIAGDLGTLGLMLPYSPLHHLLMRDLGFPVVATSGNLSDEPICTDPSDGLRRFAGIADLLLVHNRLIVRSIDDSVVRVMAGRVVVFRRARGYAPLPLNLPGATRGFLAVGAHLKNSVAIALDGEAVVGQHVGDLDNLATRKRMEAEICDLGDLYGLACDRVAYDLHPDYASTRFAEESGLERFAVQHHLAHAAACLAENGVDEPAIAVVWDGAGLGPDGTVWGGEFFAIDGSSARRVGCVRPFPLPGGDSAARKGRRSALGLLYEAFGGFMPWFWRAFADDERRLLEKMLTNDQCILTSSAGRLFDGFAALGAGIAESRFEGDAAMRFEALAGGTPRTAPYPFAVRRNGSVLELDWALALHEMFEDTTSAIVASRFHAGLARAIADMVSAIDSQEPGTNRGRVCLTGGCFQNKLLLEGAICELESDGWTVMTNQRIPPNDGGIAYGQLCAAIRSLRLLDSSGNPYA